MTEALAKGFEEENGAKVQVRYGEDEGLASQIEQEGDASPADVVLTENTPPLELLAEKELLAKVDSSTLDEVPSQYNSPSGHWVGVAARETVMVYNPKLIAADELPASILDLAKPEWKGKLAIAPSEPDFVPIVSAIEKLDGEAAAKSWLEGFAANAKHYNDNEGIIAAVDSGQIARRDHQPLLLVRGGGRGRQGQGAVQAPLLRPRRPRRAGQHLRRRRARIERRPRARPGIPRLPGQRGRPEQR